MSCPSGSPFSFPSPLVKVAIVHGRGLQLLVVLEQWLMQGLIWAGAEDFEGRKGERKKASFLSFEGRGIGLEIPARVPVFDRDTGVEVLSFLAVGTTQ